MDFSPPPEMSFENLLRQTPPSQVHLPSFSSFLEETSSARSTLPRIYSRSQPHVIDLTADTSPPTPLHSSPDTMPRRSSHEPARKRRRIIRDEISDFDTQESGPSLAPTHFPFDDFVTIDDEVEDSDVVEEVDLRAIEDEEDLRKAQEEQKKQREAQKQRDRLQKEALAGQKPVQNEDGPATLVNFSCIICMDSVTNLTATHCGKAPNPRSQARTDSALAIFSAMNV